MLAEWQGVVVYPPDFVLLALLIFSLLRMGIDVNYAERLRQTIYRLFHKNQAWVWVLWVVWCGLGIIWAHQPIITAFNALQLALTLAMVFVLADLVQIEQTRSLLLVFALGAAVQGMVALLQTVHGGPIGLAPLGEIDGYWTVPGGVYRGSGLTVNPNNLAGFLMIGIFVCIALVNFEKGGLRANWLPLALGTCVTAGLIASMSRAAILGVAIGLIPLAVVTYKKTSSWLRLKWVVIEAVVIVAALIVLAVLLGFQNRLNFFFDREFYFEQTNLVIARSPILGVGAGNLALEMYKDNPWATRYILVVHNMYWMMWAEIGLPGAILCISGVLFILRGLWNLRNAWAYGWVCCFLAMSIAMLFDYYYWGDTRSRDLWFWVLGLYWAYNPLQAN